MNSICFPSMFNTNNTKVYGQKDYLAATKQNTSLLLHCERGELFGDPYFGLLFKHYLFNQNNYILKDILIDMIYTQIVLFIPQIKIERKDIDIIQEQRGTLVCKFSCINQIDYQLNTYNLTLYSNSDI